MLTVFGRKQSLCRGMSRRSFLTAGSLGLAGLTLADLLKLRAQGAGGTSLNDKAVILVYLPGGPSQTDTYDMKPKSPAEYRGEFNPIATNVPGMDICELMPLQARIADKFSIVRGLHMRGSHFTELVTTGFVNQEGPNRPPFGSVVSRLRPGGEVPPYVSLWHAVMGRGEDPGYLGAAHRPFVPSGPGLKNLGLGEGMTVERLSERKSLLQSFDSVRSRLDSMSNEMDAFNAQALRIISSNKARDAFDISREPAKVQEKFNAKNYKSAMFLAARRLVEAGVSVVTLSTSQSWDTHVGNFKKLRRTLPELDRNIYNLVTDLQERGLDKKVAVIVMGEMGRTPRINNKAGRDHWADAAVALVSGGGLRMGQVVGATDAYAARAIDTPYNTQNVLATLYHVLGIDPSQTFLSASGRPMYILDDRRKIEELL